MKKGMFIGCAILIIVLAGCSFVPRSVGRPWSRTLSNIEIVPGSRVSVIAECTETPILGSDQLVNNELKATATELLQRRGFVISDQNPDYTLKIFYKTTRTEEETSVQTNESTSNMGSIFAVSGSSGYGVMLAQSLGLIMANSTSRAQSITRKYEAYKHQLTCEMYSNQDYPIWKHDTETKSKDINILSYSKSFLQMAFTGLPSTKANTPVVPEFKKDRLDSFTNMYLVDKYFICPALPNYIVFNTYLKTREDYQARGITASESLMAFLDLLQTAEYAIPYGSGTDWNNPTQSRLWKQATLIGKYRLGESKTPINVVISLVGTPNSYEVKECKLVSDVEYMLYQSRYDAWKKALHDYYQFYE